MTEEERRRFESLESLRRAAYESFDDRRSYEWKLSLAIWTAQAIVLAGLLQPTKSGEVFPLKAPCAWIGAALVGLLLVLLHGYWSNGFSRANAVDKHVSLHFRKAMQDMLSLPFDTKLTQEIEELSQRRGWKQWSHIAQISITALLASISVVIIGIRS